MTKKKSYDHTVEATVELLVNKLEPIDYISMVQKLHYNTPYANVRHCFSNYEKVLKMLDQMSELSFEQRVAVYYAMKYAASAKAFKYALLTAKAIHSEKDSTILGLRRKILGALEQIQHLRRKFGEPNSKKINKSMAELRKTLCPKVNKKIQSSRYSH